MTNEPALGLDEFQGQTLGTDQNTQGGMDHGPIGTPPFLCQILTILCGQSLCRSQRDRFGLWGDTSLPQDAEHSEQRRSLPPRQVRWPKSRGRKASMVVSFKSRSPRPVRTSRRLKSAMRRR